MRKIQLLPGELDIHHGPAGIIGLARGVVVRIAWKERSSGSTCSLAMENSTFYFSRRLRGTAHTNFYQVLKLVSSPQLGSTLLEDGFEHMDLQKGLK